MNTITKACETLFALNKPKGYLVTRSDDLGRKTVYSLLPQWAFDNGWMPIGRLDLESKGLLLFTRSGKINDMLTKPGNCKKIYEVWVRGFVTQEHIEQARVGVESKYGLLKAKVEKLGIGGAKTKLKIELEEGKNRHIRRLFGALKDPKFGTNLKVISLSRVSIGSFDSKIESGTWRFLSIEEEKLLLKKS
ncbi:pseudouridine synthase [Poseidonibacter ostreae]|uniref:RNA pseudouridylate synthase n=1 Tax=Poseidonibacter ostreae TaxID=2654171 RepID=A0ABQ6VQM9_9BACT|nr:pseudouridine synthase [Poseidonibacter ostreae]KAB7884448.1 pseudouridine synthase [Poseidonibacter ostreae]KAB7892937.1 pseudouridine synthase [Poseidonibacter ostreae]